MMRKTWLPVASLVTVVGALLVVVAFKNLASADSQTADPDALLVDQLETALESDKLSAEGRSLLQAKLDAELGQQATRTAAPRPTKAVEIMSGTVVAPTIAPFEPFIGEVRNSPYHGGIAVANNEWNGLLAGHPASVVAGNLGEDRDRGILTVWIRAVGETPSTNYSVRIPRATGKLVLTDFDETTVVAEGADGSRWRLDIASRVLTEER